MLLIGRLQKRDTKTFIELTDGTQFQVQLSGEISLPTQSRCAAIGKMISTDEVPLVQLVAGVVVQ